MNKILRGITPLFSLLLVVSCTMPETRIYSINVPPDNIAHQPVKQGLVTLRVISPRYLSQPYIAHRLSPYQLEISRYAKWDSSPADMVREVFREMLYSTFQYVRTSSYAVEGSQLLTVNLKRFERVDEVYGELLFDAILFSAEGKEINRNTTQKRVLLETTDDAGLAKGLSSALSESVREFVKGLGSRI